MNKTQWNKKQIAESYDFGRPLDEKIIIKLLNTIQTKYPQFSKNISLLDAGSGTGRMTIPISRRYEHIQVIGTDISEEMLAVLKNKITAQNIQNYKIVKGDLLHIDFADNYFDATLISSVLHGIRKWENIVDELVRITKSHGFLLLLSEQSDLYDIGLGRVKSTNKNLLERFWGKYIEFRTKQGIENPEKSQVGIKWQLRHPEVINFLKKKNLITRSEDITSNWNKEFTIADFMKIVKDRPWSSMFTADDDKYEQLILDMNKWLKEQNIFPADVSISKNILKCEIIQIAK